MTVSARPVTCEVLHFFDEWRTSRAAVARFAEYTSRSVRSTLSELVEHGLLIVKDSPEAIQDSLIEREWRCWLPYGSFHFSTKDARYIRESWSSDRLKSILPRTRQPKIFKTLGGAKKLLPSRSFPDSEFIRVLLARTTHVKGPETRVTIRAQV